MPTRKNPVKFSKRLSDTLNNHNKISALLMSIDPNNMSKKDKIVLEAIDTAAKNYLSSDAELKHEWNDMFESLKNMIEWGADSDRGLIAALILAGAAIDRPDVTLREDLSQSLVEARQKYQAVIHAQPSPLLSTVIERLEMPRSKANFVVNIAKSYKVIKTKMDTGSKLDAAIKSLLQDNTKPLRVGYDFRNLDIDRLIQERDSRFGKKPVGESTILPNTSGSGQKDRQIVAPTSLELKAINFDCIKRQEDSTDEIFWVAHFYRMKNLVEVYNQIDEAIRNERLNKLELDLEWERNSWVSSVHTGTNENSNKVPLNHNIGLTDIHHGFCPWICNITCVEEDDSEYEAINEVIDTIDDIAETIGYGASTVAVLSGPTPAGAVAGAVASVADIVSFACDVVGAVVDIVNFFDENDTIGFTDQQGLYDYAGVPAQTTDPFPLQVGKLRGAKYLIRTEYNLAGQESFNRIWRYEQATVHGSWKHHDPFGFHGGSGDDVTTLQFSNPVHSLIAHGVQDNFEAGVRHAEWKAAPQLQNDQRTIKGVVHWGVSWENEIDYRAWASGLRFLTNV